MKKTILTLISLITVVGGIIVARRVLMPGSVNYASHETLKPSEVPSLKEWINNSIDKDVPPGYVPRYQWAGDAERAQLESVWANAATNLLHGDIKGMKECVALVSESSTELSDLVKICSRVNLWQGFCRVRTHPLTNLKSMS